jgi:hypothetical protein
MGKSVTIDLPFGEGCAQVTGYYTPGRAGKMYKRNGDPGDPPEPEEFEVESIIVGGVDITEELVGVCKEVRQGMCTSDWIDWIDWYIEKHMWKIVEAYSDER